MTGTVILDYGVGNLRNVQKAFERVGENAIVTSDPSVVGAARAIVLPGVGAFGDAMTKLKASGLVDSVLKAVRVDAKPILGICLGMQLLARSSEEGGRHEGLGLIAADVRKLDVDAYGLRLPHMGWDGIRIAGRSKLFAGIDEDTDFYFAHSYHVVCDSPGAVAARSRYGFELVVGIEQGNVFGAQFHPEKSQDAGRRMIANFVATARGA